MLLKARVLLPQSAPPISEGAVRVRGSRIEAVGEAAAMLPLHGEEVLELGDVALLPGFINAHCHLDYSSLRHAIDPPSGFTEWVQRLNSIKRQLSDEDILGAIAKGYAEAQRFGTTTICSMAAFPDLLPRMGPPPVRTWWFYEMIDIRHRITSEELVEGALAFFNENPSPLVRFGLNPHAPYTASLLLYRLAQACAAKSGMALTTHLAESEEETRMFLHQTGPLHDFLARLDRPMHDCGHDTPLRWLWQNNAINREWILAHMNALEEADFALLESLPANALPHVVHCPGSHAYFQHPPFQSQRLSAIGVNWCVGTDSLASTDSLSLLGELRRLHASQPGIPAEEWLHRITLAPARALQCEGELGCIAPGAFADLIAIPLHGIPIERAAHACLHHRTFIPWMMVDGKIMESAAG